MNEPRTKSPSRSAGTSSTATAGRWPGGCNGEGPFEACVAITRGGLVPAAIVARELNIRTVDSVAVKSYDHQSAGRDQGAEADRPPTSSRRPRPARRC